ncbi:MAG TPA: START-like domain-containing protein [Vicingaceae bacterium]|nr:START-like domain-containing protein [Vicingaceae bacterium]
MSEKIKFEQEFIIKASSKMLYNYISTPSAMSEWFAEDVNLKDGIFTFSWDGAEEQAKVISKVKGKCIRFRWLEEEDDEAYVELKIETDELTKEVALIVTDFAYEDELEEAKMLWESQISDLHHVIGV